MPSSETTHPLYLSPTPLSLKRGRLVKLARRSLTYPVVPPTSLFLRGFYESARLKVHLSYAPRQY